MARKRKKPQPQDAEVPEYPEAAMGYAERMKAYHERMKLEYTDDERARARRVLDDALLDAIKLGQKIEILGDVTPDPEATHLGALMCRLAGELFHERVKQKQS